jgi:hypothetical protein
MKSFFGRKIYVHENAEMGFQKASKRIVININVMNVQGRDSQKFSSQMCKLFVNLGLNVLRLKVLFFSTYH